MLKQLDVYSPTIYAPPYLLNPLGSEDTDPIQIRKIDGLGPVSADINTSDLGSSDGSVFHDSRVGKRNIVITFGLNPNWAFQTNEGLRKMLYDQFTPKSLVRLVITSTTMEFPVQISGYVESFEPNIFEKDPEYQVSILCPSPYFTDIEPQVIEGICAATDSIPGYPAPQAFDIDYLGTASTGFVVDINPGESTWDDLTIFSTYAGRLDVFSVTGVTINSTTKLKLSTVSGDKYVRQISSPSPPPPTSLLGDVSSASTWPQFRRGLNEFQITYSTNNLPFVLSYYNRWAGL